MATNGITSSRAPKVRTTRTKMRLASLSNFAGDPLMEKGNGKRGRLSNVAANSMTGLTAASKRDLLREAGIDISTGQNG